MARKFLSQFIMISTSTKSIFFVVGFISLVYRIHCNPLFNALKPIDKSESYSQTNNYNYNNITDVEHFRLTEGNLDTDRIFGGYYAKRYQFPFMVVVHQLLGSGSVGQCGGTIISDRWVLTAGHCIGNIGSRFLLVFGIINKIGIAYDRYYGRGVSMLTEDAYLHPNHRETLNDIGLLRTPKRIPFGENIKPIQLVGFNDIDTKFNDRMGIVIGWGKDGQYKSATRRLKYAILPIVSNYECRRYWHVTMDQHVCTAANYGQDACQGDSGGPLIVFERGVPNQIGIVSYGDQFCPSKRPGVFSRVTRYVDWIQDVTGLNF